MGLKTSKETFTKDLALVIDCIRGLIYRDFDIAHAAQLMANKMVAIKFSRGGKASAARIDYSSFMKKSPNKQVFNDGLKREVMVLNSIRSSEILIFFTYLSFLSIVAFLFLLNDMSRINSFILILLFLVPIFILKEKDIPKIAD